MVKVCEKEKKIEKEAACVNAKATKSRKGVHFLSLPIIPLFSFNYERAIYGLNKV